MNGRRSTDNLEFSFTNAQRSSAGVEEELVRQSSRMTTGQSLEWVVSRTVLTRGGMVIDNVAKMPEAKATWCEKARLSAKEVSQQKMYQRGR